MLLTVDIGNSNVTLGVFDEENLLFVARMATDRKKTSDQYAIDLKDILNLYKVTAGIDGVIISSGVPVLTTAFKQAILMVTGVAPMVLGPGVKTGLNIKIDNPAQLGADLVATAVAVTKKHPLPAIVFDLGTATTVSVIDGSGSFLGAIISAGIGISLDALTGKTSQLPDISIESPPNVIGTNTIDSMKSGLVLGTAAMLDGLTLRIEEQIGQEATLIATGGLSQEVIKNCKRSIIYSDNLLLEGLKIIYNKNR